MSNLIDNQIDREYLADISGGDSEFERELVDTFYQSAPSLIADYRSALSEGNMQGIRHASHTLKGSSRAIGATKFGSVCELAEDAARQGDLDKCGERLELVVDAFNQLGQACEAFVAEAA